MYIFKKIFSIFVTYDFLNFNNTNVILHFYIFVFIILFLENGLLPAAFLPGDSLLIISGVLMAQNKLNIPLTIVILTIASILGSWLSFQQGKWLETNKIIKMWLTNIPEYYHKRAYRLFHTNGLSALLIGKFLAFIRTLLPTLSGLSGLNIYRFQLFNFFSSLLWVIILTMIGFLLANTSIFQLYKSKILFILIVIQILFIIIGSISTIVFLFKKNKN